LLKLITTACGVVLCLLVIVVFKYPAETATLVCFGSALAIFGTLREKSMPQASVLTLNLLFMLLIIGVFGTSGTWSLENISLFLTFLSVSAIAGGIESILFSSKKIHPAAGLLFTVLFWAPVAVPVYFIIQNKLGTTGGAVGLVVLLIIVIRDLQRRKKEKFNI